MNVNVDLLENKKIGLAVSGGMDSMALLHYCVHNLPSQHFCVINVDHSLRGDQSVQDSLFVIDFCNKHNILHYSSKLNICNLSGSTENWARTERYNFFQKLLSDKVVDVIATAHHENDNAESILLHLFRGSGLNGARGMQEFVGGFVRPLLQVSKKSIQDYVVLHNVPFVQDDSNFDNYFTRNFLRNQILPMIENKIPNCINSLVNFADICAQDDDYIFSQTPEVLVNNGEVVLECKYATLPRPILNRYILRAFHSLNIFSDIYKKHLDILANFFFAQIGQTIDINKQIIIKRVYDGISISLVRSFSVEEIALRLIKNLPTKNLRYDDTDFTKAAIWRFRQEGDTFCKFGGGTKSLKKYLIDCKISQSIRDYIPLLCDGNNVLIISGLQVSELLRVKTTYKEIYFDKDFFVQKLNQLR